MQSALEEADHESVSGDRRTEEIRKRAREGVTGLGAQRLAGAEPDERVVAQSFAKRRESAVQRATRRESAPVQAFAIDQRATPFAVSPELQLGDRPLALM